MPEVTVAMPAYNARQFIQQAIDSVLHQEGVDLELIVVDDGSTDDTAAIVASQADGRVRLLRNPRRRGIGYCHNLIVRQSTAPFLAHVDADDFLLPGALRKMLDTLQHHPDVGQAHCYFFDVDEHGKTTLQAFQQRWRSFHRKRPVSLDYKARLPSANVANALRTYRRALLEQLGGFNERLQFGVDYDMSLRMIDRYPIRLVPEFLYVRRVHRTNTTESLAFKTFRFWAQNYRIKRALVREQRVRFLVGSQFDLPRYMRDQLRHRTARIRERLRDGTRHVSRRLRWAVAGPAGAALHRVMLRCLSWWPLDWSAAPSRAASEEAPRLAYYVEVFPVLSETFVQREVIALRRAGVPVEVVATARGNMQQLDEQASALAEHTGYLEPRDPQRVAAYARRLFRRHPMRFISLFIYTLARCHYPRKTFKADRVIFQRALCLAALLEEKGITHVHCPWAFPSTVLALVASRLLGIPYSIQARASDLYLDTSKCGVDERLAHAAFVVTNARYNEATIRSVLPREVDKRIITIHEGIELKAFRPAERQPPRAAAPRLLTVARVVEPKGLEYLLHAVRILKDAGHPVHCEIVGGPISTEMNYYVRLLKLRRTLDLVRDVVMRGAAPFPCVLEKYAEADVYVLPAVAVADGRRDVTPNSIIEAMAMRLPIISTTSGAIPELIEDGVSGLLVPPRDAQALAAAIARVLTDDALRESLGRNARKRAEEQFDIDKNIAPYAALFDR